MNRILFLDVETGGLDEINNSLLSIGLVVWDNGNILDSIEILIKSDNYNVTEAAMKINNIDLNYLKENGVEEYKAIEIIEDFCSKYFSNKVTLGGHNLWYDISFIKSLYRRNNKDFNSVFSFRIIDTMSILKYLYYSNKLDKEINSLDEAIRYFNIETKDEERHTAISDSKLTALLFTELIKK
jgi:DNA polymerase III alpha subunit (gram-positive type)